MDSLKLAQLLCSRLCHDLITPVGAISTGLEIISETLEAKDPDGVDAELMDLTSKSAQNAAKRLVYYRAAFGYSAISSLDSPGKIEQLLRPFLKTHKIDLVMQHNLSFDHENEINEYARLLINLVGVITETAPYGGKLQITIDKKERKSDHAMGLEVILSGDLVGLKPDNKAALEGTLPEDAVTPHSVQSYLTHLFMDMKDVSLEVQKTQPECIALYLKAGSSQRSLVGSLF